MVTYHCSGNTALVGSSTLVCDGAEYNDTAPVCVSAPTSVSVSGPGMVSTNTRAEFSCETNTARSTGDLVWRIVTDLGQELSDEVILSTVETVDTRGDHGTVTRSVISVIISDHHQHITLHCHSHHQLFSAHDQLVVAVHCK